MLKKRMKINSYYRLTRYNLIVKEDFCQQNMHAMTLTKKKNRSVQRTSRLNL